MTNSVANSQTTSWRKVTETEHRIYHEDAVLDYPQSGERTRAVVMALAPA